MSVNIASRKDEANTELDKPDQWIANLYKAQCRPAHKPCHSDDFEEIAQTGTVIRGVADHMTAIGPELFKVRRTSGPETLRGRRLMVPIGTGAGHPASSP